MGSATTGVDAARVRPARLADRVPLWVPALVCFAVCASMTAYRALWFDEAFTAYASTLSWTDFVSMVTHDRDAVHAAYYLLMRGWVGLFGFSPLALRLPSAILMAVACLGVTFIARDLCGRRCALLSGLVFGALPIVIAYGAEARSYALSAALAAWATWAFLRARGAGTSSWRPWLLYALLLTLTGLVFLFAWMVMLGHLAVLAADGARRRYARRAAMAWLASLVIVVPLAAIASGQQWQVAWIGRDTEAALKTVITFASDGPSPLSKVLLVSLWVLAVGGTIAAWLRAPTAESRRTLTVLAWVWLVVPGLVLVAISLWKPLFVGRYLTFCAPALALLVGMALDLMRRRWLVATGIGLAAVSGSLFLHRGSTAGVDNWQGKYDVLAQHAQPGDVVLSSPRWYEVVPRAASIPAGLQLLRMPDGLVDSEDMPAGSTTLADRPRTVWVVPFESIVPADAAVLVEAGYRLTAEYRIDDVRVVQRYDLP